MLKTLNRSVILACLAAGILAGCDNGEPEPAQGAQQLQDQLAGTLDRTFAGNPLPAVELVEPAGITLALDETTGARGSKPVLLNLWATWCAPCVVEMPLLDRLAGEMGDEVQVLTVSMDLRGAEAVEPFFAAHDFKHLPRWIDPDGALAEAFGGGAVLPLTVLYDDNGREVWRVIGAFDWDSEEARDLVREAVITRD